MTAIDPDQLQGLSAAILSDIMDSHGLGRRAFGRSQCPRRLAKRP
jgi:hypothetical protein